MKGTIRQQIKPSLKAKDPGCGQAIICPKRDTIDWGEGASRSRLHSGCFGLDQGDFRDSADPEFEDRRLFLWHIAHHKEVLNAGNILRSWIAHKVWYEAFRCPETRLGLWKVEKGPGGSCRGTFLPEQYPPTRYDVVCSNSSRNTSSESWCRDRRGGLRRYGMAFRPIHHFERYSTIYAKRGGIFGYLVVCADNCRASGPGGFAV